MIGVVAAGRVVGLTSACRLHEAREGTGYENAVGLTLEGFRPTTGLRFVVRPVESADVAPGRIARVSRCGAPRGADLVVSVARP